MAHASTERFSSLLEKSRLNLSLEDLQRWGENLGRAAHPPLLIALKGNLGAGKTTLAQSICVGFGVQDEVTSPTYSLVHRYESDRGSVYHVDLYRLSGELELTNIGWDDIISERALVIVEWPERAGSRLPDDHLLLALEYSHTDENHRILLAG